MKYIDLGFSKVALMCCFEIGYCRDNFWKNSFGKGILGCCSYCIVGKKTNVQKCYHLLNQ